MFCILRPYYLVQIQVYYISQENHSLYHYTMVSLLFALSLFLSDINIILSALPVSISVSELIREVKPLWMIRIRGYHRDVSSNCGSWLSSICRSVASESSTGPEIEGQAIGKEIPMWYREARTDSNSRSLSPISTIWVTCQVRGHPSPQRLHIWTQNSEKLQEKIQWGLRGAGSPAVAWGQQISHEVYKLQQCLTLHQPSEHKRRCFTSTLQILCRCPLWPAQPGKGILGKGVPLGYADVIQNHHNWHGYFLHLFNFILSV